MEQKLEAILFYKNEPTEIRKLASILNIKEEEVREGLKNLQESLQQQNRGICLILTDKEASLATAREATELIEQIAKDEMSKDIGKAGLETLSIILYNEGVGRRDVDYIRGVNSTFILRNLLSRGLIERTPNPKDNRTFVYKPSLALLAHLGVRRLEELPDFTKLKEELNKIDFVLVEPEN